MTPSPRGMTHVLWAIVQSWGGRSIVFLVFVILAQLLSPEEFGIASTSSVVLLLIGYLADLGFSDAIVQRRNLENDDATLPFYLSLGISMLLAAVVCLSAQRIEQILGVPGLAPVLAASSALAPLAALSLFQEAFYRRELAFRSLAVRMLVANTLAGAVATLGALAGLGVWSLVVQSLVATATGVVWLWSRPRWLPSRGIKLLAVPSLMKFGLNTFAVRLLDFGATRVVDFVILLQYGAIGLGIYTVGSRIHLTLLLLLQGAFSDVGLSLLSRVSHDRQRLSEIYTTTTVVSAFFGAPIFVLLSAISAEICAVLFGDKWPNVGSVSSILLLLGSIQCVQFLNGTYLSSLGRPGLVLALNLLRIFVVFLAIIMWPQTRIDDTVLVFATAQFMVAPASFAVASHCLGLSLFGILSKVFPIYAAACSGFFAVFCVRMLILDLALPPFAAGATLGLVFVVFSRRKYRNYWTHPNRDRQDVPERTEQGNGNELMSVVDFLKRFVPPRIRAAVNSKREALAIQQLFRQWVAMDGGPPDGVLAIGSRRRSPQRPPRRILVAPTDPFSLIGARGDDAMISTAVHMARSQVDQAQVFVVTATDAADDAARERKLEPLNIWKAANYTRTVENALKSCAIDAVVVVGGDVIDGHYGVLNACKLLVTADIAARRGIPATILGFSFNRAPAKQLKPFLDALHPGVQINLRDRVSRDRFEKFTAAASVLVADSAFLLPADTESIAKQRIKEWADARKAVGDVTVGFNLHPMLFDNPGAAELENIVARTAEAIEIVSGRYPVSWYLFPHDYRGKLGDERCLLPLYRRLESPLGERVAYLSGQHSAAALKAAVGELDGVVAGRMHLAIAALGAGVPVMSVTYQDKFEGLYSHFGLPSWLLLPPGDLVAPTALADSLLHYLDAIPALTQMVGQDLPRIKELSETNYRLFLPLTADA